MYYCTDMCNYQRWNDEIYKSYFINGVISSHQMFSVDEYIIQEIGEKLGIDDSINDFEKSVLLKICNYKNGKFHLSLDINLSVSKENIPIQTAIIAFFVYIAGKTISNKKYNPNAYWPKLADVVKKHFGEIDLQALKSNHNNLYQNLFADFAEKVSKNEDIDFFFENPFSWKHVGIPMFQAMITSNDYCILTQEFDKYKKSKINSLNLYDFVTNNPKYSSVFKKIKNLQKEERSLYSGIEFEIENNLKSNFCKKIEHLYENWDGNVYFDDNELMSRKRKVVNLLYEYNQVDEDKFDFYYTAEAKSDYKNIKFNDRELVKLEENKKYYERIPISGVEISLKEKLYNLTIPNLQRLKKDYIKLKKEGRTFIEKTAKDSIRVGDRFSIIADKKFFSEKAEELEYRTGQELSITLIEDTNPELYLLHDIEFLSADNDIVVIDTKEKIVFEKGLKSTLGNNSWVKNAEPILKINDLRFVTIDNVKQKSSVIDLRFDFNDVDKHSIKLETSNEHRSYIITPIEFVDNPEGFKTCYHVIKNHKIERSFEAKGNYPIIFGANIGNISYKLKPEKKNKNKKEYRNLYILKILNAHKNEKNYIMPLKLKQKLQEIADKSSEILKNEVLDYLKNNNYIDNYINIFLNYMELDYEHIEFI